MTEELKVADPFLSWMTPVKIPLERLREHCDVTLYWPWTGPVKNWLRVRSRILRRMESGLVIRKSYSELGHPVTWTIEHHIRRIAFLVAEKDETPVELDVGCPSLNHYRGWLIDDGNHRFVAAVVRGDAHIYANVEGEIEYAEKLFGVKIPLTN